MVCPALLAVLDSCVYFCVDCLLQPFASTLQLDQRLCSEVASCLTLLARHQLALLGCPQYGTSKCRGPIVVQAVLWLAGWSTMGENSLALRCLLHFLKREICCIANLSCAHSMKFHGCPLELVAILFFRGNSNFAAGQSPNNLADPINNCLRNLYAVITLRISS